MGEFLHYQYERKLSLFSNTPKQWVKQNKEVIQ